MKYILSICLQFCFFFTAAGQILNVEKIRLDKDSTAFVTDLGFSLTLYNRTADEENPLNFLSLNGKLDLAYVTPNVSYLLLNGIEYLDINKSPFTSTGYSHFRTNFLRGRTFSYEAFTQYQYDLLRFLDHRYLAGTGIRIRFFESDVISCWVGVGGMYEYEEWRHPVDKNIVSRNMIKSTNYLSTRIELGETTSFYAIVYYQWGYDTIDKFVRNRIHADSKLEFEINERFQFNTSFRSGYDTNPVIPVTKFIYHLSNGISLKF